MFIVRDDACIYIYIDKANSSWMGGFNLKEGSHLIELEIYIYTCTYIHIYIYIYVYIHMYEYISRIHFIMYKACCILPIVMLGPTKSHHSSPRIDRIAVATCVRRKMTVKTLGGARGNRRNTCYRQ